MWISCSIPGTGLSRKEGVPEPVIQPVMLSNYEESKGMSPTVNRDSEWNTGHTSLQSVIKDNPGFYMATVFARPQLSSQLPPNQTPSTTEGFVHDIKLKINGVRLVAIEPAIRGPDRPIAGIGEANTLF